MSNLKILVVGSGGREHALCWRMARDGHDLYAAPGSAGISSAAECVGISVDDSDALVSRAVELGIDLVVVGPEVPLVAGLADAMRAKGIHCFGPGADGAQLEGSKAFSKRFFHRHGIRSAAFVEVTNKSDVDEALSKLGDRVVVKADGLAAGKGVVVCSSADQARDAALEMLGGRFGDAGSQLIIEERIEGREVSFMALCDGKSYQLLAQAEDHKAIFDGDEGPNTGGMGTVSPASWVSGELVERVKTEIFDKTLAGLTSDGIDFRGVLYAGLMIGDDGVPWILEYNVRFGDPETQPVLSRLRGDLGALLLAAAKGEMPEAELEWDPRTAVCVVLASAGYPAGSSKGDVITGLEELGSQSELVVFHAGTARRDEQWVTAGGRVLGVTALGDDLDDARGNAYAAVDAISFDGKQYRRDIGLRGR